MSRLLTPKLLPLCLPPGLSQNQLQGWLSCPLPWALQRCSEAYPFGTLPWCQSHQSLQMNKQACLRKVEVPSPHGDHMAPPLVAWRSAFITGQDWEEEAGALKPGTLMGLGESMWTELRPTWSLAGFFLGQGKAERR